MDKDMYACSNCKAANKPSHLGHRAVDRRCPIFLECLDKMNQTRSENKYKYYCTSNPATWETHESGHQQIHNPEPPNIRKENQDGTGARGRLGGGIRGGGGGMQRVPDSGWEGRRTDMRVGGNNGNGNKQTEAFKHGSVGIISNGIRDKGSDQVWHTGGRLYKQGTQKDKGVSQATLSDFWKGKDKDMRTWSEEMEELDRVDDMHNKGSQESRISYV